MNYTPDKWVVINIESDEPHQRVLAGWHGGYLYGDSWKLNSGIKETIDRGDHYEFIGESGSSYICYKSCYGFTGLTRSILTTVQENFKTSGFTVSVDTNYEPAV